MIKLIRKFYNFIFFKLNHLINVISSILFFAYRRKKRELLRNSDFSEKFFDSFMKKKWNVEKLRKQFFDFELLSYSNLKEKPKIVNFINNSCKKEKKEYINRANEILKNRVEIFKNEHIFKKEINWHYGFYKNYIWKLKKSEEIEIRPKMNSENNIDVKYVWELNRHQFLPYLGFAYYMTNDEKYSLKFKELITNWIKKNPPLIGVNWISGLEISIRLISWIFALKFFKDSKKINNKNFLGLIFKSMFQHSYHLRYFYSKRSFNHTVGDLLGLYLFSKIFKKLKPINKWEKKFFKKFQKQIYLQTRPDGTNIEQSVNYQRFVLEFFTLFIIINQKQINEIEKIFIEKQYEFLLYVIKPNGSFPFIGDSDDGKVLLLTYFEKNPFNYLINLGSMLFNRGDLKYISNKLTPISILLLGSSYLKSFNELQSQEAREKIKRFDDGGYYVFRENWTNKSNYLFIDYGRFGAQTAGHTHSSITNFIYSYKGKDIIIDSGTYTYNKSLNERNLFRSSKAHNVLTINNENQAKLGTYFAWGTKPKIKRSFKENNGLFALACYHDGYKGFLVKRKIVTNIDLNNIIIEDYVFPTNNISNRKPDEINIFIHFNNDVKIRLEENRVMMNNELSLEVSSNQDFQMNIEKGLRSPYYGFKYEIEVLNIHITHNFENGEDVYVKSELKSLK